MKCDICSKKIAELYLSKIKGTYINVDKKQKAVCAECQSKYKNKIKEEIK